MTTKNRQSVSKTKNNPIRMDSPDSNNPDKVKVGTIEKVIAGTKGKNGKFVLSTRA